MASIPSPKQAEELLYQYNSEEFHRLHGRTVAGVMRYFAGKYDSGNEDYWYAAGMLHDIDYEQYPEEHCVKGQALLREADVDESLIRSAMSHGWGQTDVQFEPELMMEKVLFAVDELTGLIWAYALMRPEKSTAGMELKSLKKKFKDKKFAAGCSRDTIREGAEKLGWELDRLFSETIAAMQSLEGADA